REREHGEEADRDRAGRRSVRAPRSDRCEHRAREDDANTEPLHARRDEKEDRRGDEQDSERNAADRRIALGEERGIGEGDEHERPEELARPSARRSSRAPQPEGDIRRRRSIRMNVLHDRSYGVDRSRARGGADVSQRFTAFSIQPMFKKSPGHGWYSRM